MAIVLRALTMAGYAPLWFDDAFEYVGVARRMQPYAVRPSGYSIFLRSLEPLRAFAAVALVQHLMGLAIGVMVYLLARRRAALLPRLGAALIAAPVLLDAYLIFFEHAILSDVLFAFLVMSAVTLLLWNGKPSIVQVCAAGVLLAFAVLTRSIGLALIPLVLGFLLLLRCRLRNLLAAATAVVLPLAGYAAWYQAHHGIPGLNGGSGVWLWARTMPFIHCERIRPPADEAALCPAQPRHLRPASPYFIWSDWSPLRGIPEYPITTRADLFHPGIDRLAGRLARRAILEQPLDYAATVAFDLSRTFGWRRGPNPLSTRITYNRYGFPNVRGPLPDDVRIAGATVRQDLEAYEGGPVAIGFTEPFASIMRAYQAFVYVPGAVFGGFAVLVTLLYGRACLSRVRGKQVKQVKQVKRPADVKALKAAALPLAVGVVLIAAPAAVTAYDSRYWLPAVPMFCVALALTRWSHERPSAEAEGRSGAAEGRSGAAEGRSGAPPLGEPSEARRGERGGGTLPGVAVE
ncbi:hypothetical protein [Sinosporangium album]|nr:hypothetical protein [Sinosporangium album]